jgi:hypothetical protein
MVNVYYTIKMEVLTILVVIMIFYVMVIGNVSMKMVKLNGKGII